MTRAYATKPREERVATCVTEARRLCGCTQCHGGYEIGARTIAAANPGTGPTTPTSCLAKILLKDLLRRLPANA